MPDQEICGRIYNQICFRENVIRLNYVELFAYDLIQGPAAIARSPSV